MLKWALRDTSGGGSIEKELLNYREILKSQLERATKQTELSRAREREYHSKMEDTYTIEKLLAKHYEEDYRALLTERTRKDALITTLEAERERELARERRSGPVLFESEKLSMLRDKENAVKRIVGELKNSLTSLNNDTHFLQKQVKQLEAHSHSLCGLLADPPKITYSLYPPKKKLTSEEFWLDNSQFSSDPLNELSALAPSIPQRLQRKGQQIDEFTLKLQGLQHELCGARSFHEQLTQDHSALAKAVEGQNFHEPQSLNSNSEEDLDLSEINISQHHSDDSILNDVFGDL